MGQATAKQRVERVDPTHTRKVGSLARWKAGAAVAVTGLGLAWLLIAALTRDPSPYLCGPVSPSHQAFATRCGMCHVERWRSPPDRVCQTCHQTGAHHPDLAVPARCSTCHREHGKGGRLAALPDRACTPCHARSGGPAPAATSMDRRSPADRVPGGIARFSSAHPDWGSRLKAPQAASSLSFSHARHLQPQFRTPRGRVDLACTACHLLREDGTRMRPIRYARHCASCHPLDFDPKLPGVQVPHQAPQAVESFVVERYRLYAREHPRQIEIDLEDADLPPPASPAPASVAGLKVTSGAAATLTTSTVDLWAGLQLTQARKLLFADGGRCAHCHRLRRGPGKTVPEIEPPRIPSRWLNRARFRHRKHRLLACAACHRTVRQSTRSADVLIPGIQTCRGCHGAPDSVRAECVLCHDYHDRSRSAEFEGPLPVPDLSGAQRYGDE